MMAGAEVAAGDAAGGGCGGVQDGRVEEGRRGEHPRLYYPRCISGPPVIEPCQARYVAADERGWGGAPGARHATLHLKS